MENPLLCLTGYLIILFTCIQLFLSLWNISYPIHYLYLKRLVIFFNCYHKNPPFSPCLMMRLIFLESSIKKKREKFLRSGWLGEENAIFKMSSPISSSTKEKIDRKPTFYPHYIIYSIKKKILSYSDIKVPKYAGPPKLSQAHEETNRRLRAKVVQQHEN